VGRPNGALVDALSQLLRQLASQIGHRPAVGRFGHSRRCSYSHSYWSPEGCKLWGKDYLALAMAFGLKANMAMAASP
jgi:hypothetical protein